MGQQGTLDTVGAERVVVSTGKGDADGKRMCTLQLLVRNIPGHAGQPPPTIAFRGKDRKYYEKEHPAVLFDSDQPAPAPVDLSKYHPEVRVMHQPKAWFGKALCLDYLNQIYTPWAMRVFGNEPNSTRRLMVMDNLHGQTTEEFKDALSRSGTDAHYGPAGMTDDWQVIDKSIGKMVKDKMGHLRAKWEHGKKSEFLQKVSAGTRRVQLTHWLAEAFREVCESDGGQLIPKMFGRVGQTMTNTGLPDGTELSFQSVKQHIKIDGAWSPKFGTDTAPAPAQHSHSIRQPSRHHGLRRRLTSQVRHSARQKRANRRNIEHTAEGP